jgi:MFS family permease
MNHSLLRALAHRNYRLYFLGQGVSLIGTWMQQVAMSWLVYTKTNSPFKLGLVLFCGQAPALFLAPVAGVLVDRWHRHRVLLGTQSLAMLQAFLLAALTLTQVITVWQVLVLSLFLGMVNTFDMTTRQAFLTEMVTSREDLGNAIALNSSLVNGARLVGPALAGVLLARAGTGICFLANGLSYLAVLAALLAMRLGPRPPRPPHAPLLHGLREGFRYAWGFPPIRALLLLLALVSLAGMSYGVLLPGLSKDVLHGEAGLFSALTAATGVGALTGALFLALRRSVLGLGRWLILAPLLVGGSFIGLTFIHETAIALALLAVAGFALMVQMAANNTILQTIVEEDKRGRVMSFYTMAFLGMAPIGNLLAGALADGLGVAGAFGVNGLVCVAAGLIFGSYLPRMRALVQPIYLRLNILPAPGPATDGTAPARKE